jgi:hypothetical protein
MTMLRNLVFGTALAAACLAPVAWADGNRVLSGQPPAAADVGIGQAMPPLGVAVSAANAALPHLLADAIALLTSARPERH